VIPLGDDNTDRRTKPFVTWLLIAVNVIVFVALQGFGSNLRFTYTYSTVPAEILTGQDVVTPDRTAIDRSSGRRFQVPALIAVGLWFVFQVVNGLGYLGGGGSGCAIGRACNAGPAGACLTLPVRPA